MERVEKAAVMKEEREELKRKNGNKRKVLREGTEGKQRKMKKHRKLGGGGKKKKMTPGEGREMMPQTKRKLQKKQPI